MQLKQSNSSRSTICAQQIIIAIFRTAAFRRNHKDLLEHLSSLFPLNEQNPRLRAQFNQINSSKSRSSSQTEETELTVAIAKEELNLHENLLGKPSNKIAFQTAHEENLAIDMCSDAAQAIKILTQHIQLARS